MNRNCLERNTYRRTVSARLTGIALCLVMLVSLSLFWIPIPSNAETVPEETRSTVTSVKLDKKGENIEVLATLSEAYLAERKGNPVYLIEVVPSQSGKDLGNCEPAAEAKASAKMTFKVSFVAGTRNRLTSRFVLAEKSSEGVYTPLGDFRYIENPDLLAGNSYVYPSAISKKGLNYTEPSDAVLLGVSHTIVTIPVNEYFLNENGDNAVSYLYNGKTFYFNRSMLSKLDRQAGIAYRSGILVYLNLVLTGKDRCGFEDLGHLYYPDAPDGAAYYALNVNDETGVAYYSAFLKFLAERYTKSDHEFGFAGSFLIGYNVNANRNYHSAGPMGLEQYVKDYAVHFRMAHEILRSSYSNARLYVSVANNFTAMSPNAGTAGDSSLDYPGKQFLSAFRKEIAASGDIDWSVAVNAYASDHSNTSFWADSLAESNLETPFITMANIDVMGRFLTQEEFQYNGQVRHYIVSEFGIPTPPANGDLSVGDAEKQQAAAFALAFYKACSEPELDAVIYNRQIDTASDGLNYGLWTLQTGTENTQYSKKYLYEIFRQIDWKEPAPLTDFALSYITATVFQDAVGAYSSSSRVSRTLLEGMQTEVVNIEKAYKERRIFDFSSGNDQGFTAAEHADYIELCPDEELADSSVLHAALNQENPFEYMGIDISASKYFLIEDTRYLTVRMKAEAPADVSSVTVLLSLYSGSGSNGTYDFRGMAMLAPGEWTDVTFDVGNYLEKTGNSVKTMKLWMKSTDEKAHEGAFGFYLRSFSGWERRGLGWFSIVLIVLAVLAGIFVLVLAGLFLRGYQKKRKRRIHQQKVEEFRRMEQERQQRKLERTLQQMYPEGVQNPEQAPGVDAPSPENRP